MADENACPEAPVYQLKLTLEGARPPIWRRLLVAGDDTLAELHDIIQAVMGWENYHLYEFDIDKQRYGPPDDETESETFDDESFTLDDVLAGSKKRIKYVYDFGDCWRVNIAVEKVLPFDPGKEYPVCVAGARNGPPEDSGGVWGYEEKLAVLHDPSDPNYGDVAEWMGADWDPEYFDLDEINAALDPGIYDEEAAEELFESLDEDEQEALLKSLMDGDPFLAERVARLHAKIAQVHGLDSPEAVHEFIESFDPGKLKDFGVKYMLEDPVEAAHDLGLQALAEEDDDLAQEYAEKALQLDSRNVDARIVKAQHCFIEDETVEGIALLREALAVAEENLGPGFVERHGGELADRVEARPYMRARYTLGHFLQRDRQLDEAFTHLNTLLTLDPDDCMGVRYCLLGLLLQARRLEETRALLDRFEEDKDPVMDWGRVLERYLAGDKPGAQDALEAALDSSPLVATYLLEPETWDEPEDTDEESTVVSLCVHTLARVWTENEDARDWLAAFVYDDTEDEDDEDEDDEDEDDGDGAQ